MSYNIEINFGYHVTQNLNELVCKTSNANIEWVIIYSNKISHKKLYRHIETVNNNYI